jgi:hypothetical protein
MSPFIDRKPGLKWFKWLFSTKDFASLEDNIEVWKNYLTPSFLPVRITTGKTYYKVIGYCQHLVVRQFSLSQLHPPSIPMILKMIYDDDFDKLSEAQYQQCLHSLDGHIPDFVHVSFHASHECTESFSLWCNIYYLSNLVNETSFCANLISAFPYLQSKTKKNKGMHIKEIQAFHNFFEVVYNPLNV